ncbi:MAG: hypothetical protein DRJ01_00670 [Bacteroidetes bacterium]|nr:MAG: hypothetical protein DRJ01_00670 [Bacteroidota bacterium]
MALSPQEKSFIASIEAKIRTYQIRTTLKECFEYSANALVYTIYNTDTPELVDAGIELFLIRKSYSYFLNNYARVDIPGLGTIAMEPYYFQTEMSKEIMDYRKVVLDKTRQCLTEENFVMTNNGYKSIKNVKVGELVETKAGNKTVFVPVERTYKNGKRQVCRILTNSGAEIKSTLDHLILTPSGYVEAQSLSLNDEIISIVNSKEFGDFKLENDNHAALIGYYLADGKSNQPVFVSTNTEYINEVLEIGKTFKNCFPYVYNRPLVDNHKQGYDVRLVSRTKSNKIERPILDFMRKYNLLKKSNDRILTKDLMNLNEKQMSIFINRLFAGDGYITYNKDKRRTNYIQYEIGLGAPNYTLLKQLEYILQTKYGIHCWIHEQFGKKQTQQFWKIRITQKKSIIDFINKIGIKGKTDTQEIINLISKEKPHKSNQSFEKIRKIEVLKEEENVYDITTPTSNFLTNGLMVHNSGLSTIFALYSLWRAHFFPAEMIDVVSVKQKKAQQFVKKIYSTLNNFPEWMKTPVKYQNQQEITFQHKNSTSTILSESQSENAGRGDSLSVLVLDEVAFYQSERMAREIIASAQPTLNKTGGQIILISTPNGVAGKGAYYYEQVVAARGGESKDTKYLEIDWWEVPDDERINGPNKGYNDILKKAIKEGYYYKPHIKAKYNEFFKPISREKYLDNAWLKAAHQDLGAAKYRQEILHDFIVAGDKVFSENILEKVESKVVEPIIRDVVGTSEYVGWWQWKKPIPGHRYIIGVDVSTGTSNDYSTMQILDVAEYEQAAEYKGHMSTANFGRFIKKIALYYNEAYLIIECNSIGEAIFNEVYYSDIDPYNNLYKQKKTKNGITRQTGWITDVKTRKLLTNDFIDWISVDDLFDTLKIYSKRLWLELSTWIWSGGNRPDHSDGSHDDTIIAMALALYNRSKAINSGESFLITDSGEVIESGGKDNGEGLDNSRKDTFDIIESEAPDDDMFQERFGCSKSDYDWLIGGFN